MPYFITIIILIICLLLSIVVLIQNSKGGGLASGFSSSNQVLGVRRTADFLEKATWTLAIALFVFSLVSTATMDKSGGALQQEELRFQDELENAPALPQDIQNNSFPTDPK